MKSSRLLTSFVFFASAAYAIADQPDLAQVQTLAAPDLKGTGCITVTSDGRFAYANGGSAVLVFKRDPAKGELTVADTLKGPELNTPIRTHLSHDEKQLVVADPSGNSVIIYSRDPATGALTKLAGATSASTGAVGLKGASDARLSSDNHFLYAASPNGLSVLSFDNNQLSLLQSLDASGELKGLRFTALSPSGRWLYTVANEAGTLGVFHRDLATGKLKRLEALSSGHGGVTSLRGAFRVAVSPDARNVYVSAGRFNGDAAVTAFEVQADGHLKQIQELVNGAGDFSKFEGGNEIEVSPDGKFVFAVATMSDRLFRFSRNPASGKLTFLGSQQAGTFSAPGAGGLCISPDNKFVYVADSGENAIECFKAQ